MLGEKLLMLDHKLLECLDLIAVERPAPGHDMCLS
jgi:hypothetical protein